MQKNESSAMGNGLVVPDESCIDRDPSLDERSVLDIARLVQQYHGAVYRYAYRLALSVSDAEDLTQQTFLIAQQKLAQVRYPGKVDRWLLAVLRSCFLKQCRKRVPAPMTSLEMTADEVSEEAKPSSSVDRELLDAAISELPEPFRLVLMMHYFEEYSYKEIARELEIPIGTVMSRLARAKTHIRTRMARERTAQS